MSKIKAKVANTKSVVSSGPWSNGQIPKILIGLSTTGMDHRSTMSFLEFWTDVMTYQQKGKKFHVGYKFSYRRQSVAVAQEELAEFAIQSGCSHILLMDDDIYDVKAEHLIKLLEADKDVIGGIMHTKGFPFAMCAFRRYDRKQPVANMPILKGPARLYEIPEQDRVGCQQADLLPFGFTLIKTSVFNKIKQPWFTSNKQAPTDSWFADSVMKAGMKIYAHFDIWLNHAGITRENRQFHFQLGLHEQQAKANKTGIIMLTPDEMKKHEMMMTQKLEEAEKLFKANDIKNQKFFDKDPRKPIAMPIVGVK